MNRGPSYAKINHEFDRTLLLNEIDKIPRDHFRRITATRFDKSVLPYSYDPGQPFEIASPEELDLSTYSVWNGHQKSDVLGPIDTYTHCVFTHVPDHPELLYQDNIQNEQGKYCRPYIVHKDQPWSWRTDLGLSTIRTELERLPFTYILRARVIVLWEGDHLGNVHRDSAPGFTKSWMDQGFGVINLNLLHGESSLMIDTPRGLIGRWLDDCFTFDESLYHGSTRGSEKRVQINVTGKFDFDRLGSVLDVKSVIN